MMLVLRAKKIVSGLMAICLLFVSMNITVFAEDEKNNREEIVVGESAENSLVETYTGDTTEINDITLAWGEDHVLTQSSYKNIRCINENTLTIDSSIEKVNIENINVEGNVVLDATGKEINIDKITWIGGTLTIYGNVNIEQKIEMAVERSASLVVKQYAEVNINNTLDISLTRTKLGNGTSLEVEPYGQLNVAGDVLGYKNGNALQGYFYPKVTVNGMMQVNGNFIVNGEHVYMTEDTGHLIVEGDYKQEIGQLMGYWGKDSHFTAGVLEVKGDYLYDSVGSNQLTGTHSVFFTGDSKQSVYGIFRNVWIGNTSPEGVVFTTLGSGNDVSHTKIWGTLWVAEGSVISGSSTETILRNPVSSFEIFSYPDTMKYLPNTEFDPTGMGLSVTYENGETEETWGGWTLSYDFGMPYGEKSVIVEFGGKTQELKVEVAESVDIDSQENMVQWGDHYYQFFEEQLTWKEAKQKCEELGGHLLTITSKEEQDFILSSSKHNANIKYWLGATDEETEGDWKWITGESFDYVNWNDNQPDNKDGLEDYLVLNEELWNFGWNDAPNENDSLTGYICEWEDNTPGFSSIKNGWSVLNFRESFGYPEDYYISFDKFYQTGITIPSIISSMFYRKWGGSCFGLSLLAIAAYNGQIDLKAFFDKPGETLNEYGYEGIGNVVLNEMQGNFYELVGNDDIIETIESAQCSQGSSEIRKIEVFKGDSDYSELLNYLNQDNPSPLLITMNYERVHAVVTDTTQKPVSEGNGIYKIYLYDSNAPQIKNKLQDPLAVYNYKQSYIKIDTNTGKYWYYYNGKTKGWQSYRTLWTRNIIFYDVSRLSTDFFYGKHQWDNSMTTNIITAEDISIKNEDDELVYSQNDGVSKLYLPQYEYYPYCESALGENDVKTSILMSPNDTNSIILSKGKSEYISISDEVIVSCNTNLDARLNIKFDKKKITIQNMNQEEMAFNCSIMLPNEDIVVTADGNLDPNKEISIAMIDENSDYNQLVFTNSKKEEINTLLIDGGKVIDEDFHLSFENVSVRDIQLSYRRVTIQIGQVIKLDAVITPNNASNKNIVWSSNNNNIVNVDQFGNVKAINTGVAYITVTTIDGSKTDTCKVIVKDSSDTNSGNASDFNQNTTQKDHSPNKIPNYLSSDPKGQDVEMAVEDNFWDDLVLKIESASGKQNIVVDSSGRTLMPKAVLKALNANENVTLTIKWDGGEPIIISAGQVQTDPLKYAWRLEELANLCNNIDSEKNVDKEVKNEISQGQSDINFNRNSKSTSSTKISPETGEIWIYQFVKFTATISLIGLFILKKK